MANVNILKLAFICITSLSCLSCSTLSTSENIKPALATSTRKPNSQNLLSEFQAATKGYFASTAIICNKNILALHKVDPSGERIFEIWDTQKSRAFAEVISVAGKGVFSPLCDYFISDSGTITRLADKKANGNKQSYLQAFDEAVFVSTTQFILLKKKEASTAIIRCSLTEDEMCSEREYQTYLHGLSYSMNQGLFVIKDSASSDKNSKFTIEKIELNELSLETQLTANENAKPQKVIVTDNSICVSFNPVATETNGSIIFFIINYALDGNVRKRFSGFNPAYYAGNELVFEKFEGAYEITPFVLNLESLKLRRLSDKLSPGRYQLAAGQDRKSLFLLTNGLFSFYKVINIDLSGKATTMFSLFDYSNEVLVQRKSVHTNNGESLPAYYFSSAQSAKGTLIFVHGGMCSGGSFALEKIYLNFLEALRMSWNVLAISYWKDKFPEKPTAPNANSDLKYYTECGTNEVNDIKAAISMVKTQFPQKPIVLWGHSHGAFLANLAVTKFASQSKVEGLISEDGVWDAELNGAFLANYMVVYGKYGRIAEVDRKSLLQNNVYIEHPYIVGPEAAKSKLFELHDTTTYNAVHFVWNKQLYDQINPIRFLAQLKIPVLSVHGKMDKAVEYIQAQTLVQEAAKLKKIVFTYYPDSEGHSIQNSENWPSYIDSIKSYLESIRLPD